MHFKRVSVLILLSLIDFRSINAKKSSRKFTINYTSGVTVCDDNLSQSWMEMTDLRARRYNETIGTLVGEFWFKRKIDGLWKIDVLLEKVTNSGTETIATHTMVDFCKQVKNKDQDTMYGQYLRAINFPAECPIQPGKYIIDNMIADTKEVPINSLLVGDYKLTFTWKTYEEGAGVFSKTKDTFQGCLYFQCSIEQIQ